MFFSSRQVSPVQRTFLSRFISSEEDDLWYTSNRLVPVEEEKKIVIYCKIRPGKDQGYVKVCVRNNLCNKCQKYCFAFKNLANPPVSLAHFSNSLIHRSTMGGTVEPVDSWKWSHNGTPNWLPTRKSEKYFENQNSAKKY